VIFAWCGAIVVGLTLGLLGSGGSTLTVPLLVYLVGQPEKVAIAGSLAVVASISAFGALNYTRQALIDWRSAVAFGVPGVVGAYLGAMASHLLSGAAQLTIFAAIMFPAAILMLRPATAAGSANAAAAWPPMFAAGLGVGAVTGLIGIGGGFMIVPALVILGGLPMRKAVGTALVVVTMNAAVGFYKHLQETATYHLKLDWHVIGIFIAFGIVGSIVGNVLSRRLPQARLKRFFGVFLIMMGGYILWRSAPRVL
jgi:uncharacterized membrane protein YfcA